MTDHGESKEDHPHEGRMRLGPAVQEGGSALRRPSAVPLCRSPSRVPQGRRLVPRPPGLPLLIVT